MAAVQYLYIRVYLDHTRETNCNELANTADIYHIRDDMLDFNFVTPVVILLKSIISTTTNVEF